MLKLQQSIYRECFVKCRKLKFDYSARYASNLLSENYNGGEKNKTQYQSVADFYAGKSVFITGGTGFVGKVLIERLLYNCKDLDQLYMLIRDKKGANMNERIDEMLRNPVFAKLKSEKPEALKKIIPVTGDIVLPDLGITPEDQKTIADKVSVVFHTAATVNFKEPLPVSIKINFEGTQKIHNLCKRMKNLEVFVYMSTAYSQTYLKTLKEIVYPEPAKLDDVYKFIEHHGNDKMVTQKFLGCQPNTYTFSKALAESYIAENHNDVPSIIIRPSIISSINEEPLKGWLDNWNGGAMLLHDISNGRTRLTVSSENSLWDLIPVDYVSNMTIVAAARFNRPKTTQVFNICSSSENPIKWSDACKYMIKANVKKERNEIPFPFVIQTSSTAVKKLVNLIFLIPAHVADMFLRIIGKEAKYVKIQSKAAFIRDLYERFTSGEWVIKADKVDDLAATLSTADKRQFPFDPKKIRWEEYIESYCDGMYKHLKSK